MPGAQPAGPLRQGRWELPTKGWRQAATSCVDIPSGLPFDSHETRTTAGVCLACGAVLRGPASPRRAHAVAPHATAPSFEYLWPPNRGQVVVTAPSEDGEVFFACPSWMIQGGGVGNWGDYSVNYATSPGLNAEGELATPSSIGVARASPTNAGETLCAAPFASRYASKLGTYYWQVTRTNCFAPECTEGKGPVWGFEVVNALSFESTDNSHGFRACEAARRVKAHRERAVAQLRASLSKTRLRRDRKHIRAELNRAIRGRMKLGVGSMKFVEASRPKNGMRANRIHRGGICRLPCRGHLSGVPSRPEKASRCASEGDQLNGVLPADEEWPV